MKHPNNNHMLKVWTHTGKEQNSIYCCECQKWVQGREMKFTKGDLEDNAKYITNGTSS